MKIVRWLLKEELNMWEQLLAMCQLQIVTIQKSLCFKWMSLSEYKKQNVVNVFLPSNSLGGFALSPISNF